MIRHTIARYERWLRIDAGGDPVGAAKSRAIYAVGWTFAVTQLFNLVGMWWDYHRWTTDHSVSLFAIGVVLTTIHGLRWCKLYAAYAVLYAGLLLLGVTLASPSGIHSALLPMLVWGPVTCGIIGSWRGVVLYAVAAIGLTLSLYAKTMLAPEAAGLITGREFQRCVQTILAIIIVSSMSAVFCVNMTNAVAAIQRAAHRAVRAEAAKSDFLATMSHELRTPLNGVIGLTDSLVAGDLPERERVLAETVRESGQSLLGILNDLLDLSKIEAGKLTLDPVPFDPRALTRGVGDAWREAAEAQGTQLHCAVTGELPAYLSGDELRIRQVLNNFVSNAIKFTRGGQVALGLEAARQEGVTTLLFRITDTGTGIPEDRREAVFEPFEQAEAGTTRRYGGTGLGLPICRRLAELMGGVVALERSGPGGSAFTLSLTLEEAAAPNAARAEADITCLAAARVLVAEDNAVNRLVVAEFLRSWSVEADFAHDGREAVRMATGTAYDAILMDKHMPEMGGVEATQVIRALSGPLACVPIIAVTADAMTGEREAMLAIGMDGFVAKPVRPVALKDALIAAIADTRRSRSSTVPTARSA